MIEQQGPVQEIRYNNLVLRDLDSDEVTFTKLLAASIQADGLINPPVVRPKAGSSEQYEVLAGHSRVYAMGEILQWENVPCKVVSDLTDEDALQVAQAENAFRNTPTPTRRAMLLQEWWKVYQISHPTKSGRGFYSRTGEKAEALTFPELIAAVTDCCLRTAKEDAKVARRLSGEQLDTLDQAGGLTKTDLRNVADLEHPEAIEVATSSIGSGKDIKQSLELGEQMVAEVEAAFEEKFRGVAAAKQAREEKIAAGELERGRGRPPKPRSEKKVKPAKVELDEEGRKLTDEDWITERCGRIYANLKRKDVFERDCSLYRKIMEARGRFKKAMQKILIEHKKRIPPGAPQGPLYWALARVVNLDHPSKWTICGTCSGTGVDKEKGGNCPKCFGNGYRTQIER